MNLPAAPRRPSRAAAVALLLALHIAAIESLVHLQAARERGDARLLQLLLLAVTRPAPVDVPPPEPRAARPPRALLAPLPPMDIDMPAGPQAITAPIAAAAPAPATGPADGAASAPGPAKLDLTIPKDFFTHPPKLTPAQEAMQDPRSNHLELTKQERMDIAFGSVECIAWQREPDGRIYRGPGHWRRLQGVSTNPFTAHKPGTEDRPQECVK